MVLTKDIHTTRFQNDVTILNYSISSNNIPNPLIKTHSAVFFFRCSTAKNSTIIKSRSESGG